MRCYACDYDLRIRADENRSDVRCPECGVLQRPDDAARFVRKRDARRDWVWLAVGVLPTAAFIVMLLVSDAHVPAAFETLRYLLLLPVAISVIGRVRGECDSWGDRVWMAFAWLIFLIIVAVLMLVIMLIAVYSIAEVLSIDLR